MGQDSARKHAFLRQHPLCCFCGGSEAATTVDHQPARALFDQRAWPEGYEFPACEPCNQSSKSYEHVLAALVRLNGDDSTDTARREARKFLDAMANNFPDLLTRLNANEKRHALKSYGKSKPADTTYSDLPMIGLNAQITQAAVEACLAKLMRAFHYKHLQIILPLDAALHLRWFTNVHTDEFAEYGPVIAQMCGPPVLKRGTTDLSSQFDYKFLLNRDTGQSMYAFVFRRSINAFGIVSESNQPLVDQNGNPLD